MFSKQKERHHIVPWTFEERYVPYYDDIAVFRLFAWAKRLFNYVKCEFIALF